MPTDLASLIAHDHRVITTLLDALGDTTRADRFPLAHRVLDEIAADRGQTDYDTLRPILVALEQAHPDDASFDDVVRGLAAAVEGHVSPVENEFLPALEAVIGAPAMQELGAVYASLKDNLPSGLQALPGATPGPTFRTSS